MSDFTYEITEEKRIYETYEWDNTWLEYAYDENADRVLYIGDSISCQSRRLITEKAEGQFLFDGFGTSKGIDNPYFDAAISIFAKQQPDRRAVLFNNGLHGWHLEDETEYREYYEKKIKFLLEEFKGVPLFIVLTTHIADEEREKRVIKRNKVATELAKKYKLPIIDLYTVTAANPNTLSADGVHLLKEGYELLAEEILKVLNEYI